VKLTEVCIRRPVLAWMLMAATIVFGAVAMTRIGVSQFPDVDFPNITVQVDWEGASPEAIEHDVVEPLEEAVTQVQGVRNITSVSRQGTASITVEMDLEQDIDAAMQEVQARVNQRLDRLPEDINQPTVSKSNPEDQPIMWVGLSGPNSPKELSDVARYRIKERLQTIKGVGEVTMGGFVERNVRIWVRGDDLVRKGLTVSDLVTALRREHVELPAGRIEASGRELGVRVLGEALDLSELSELVVGHVAGKPILLRDVALVEDGFEDERRRARVNGDPVQGMGIRKQRGANAVAVAAEVRAALEEVQKTLPEGMEARVNFDSTRFIEESVKEIEWELLLAVLLTALVCWMFLGSISSTANVVLAIPMSLLGTIAVIYFLGWTLNTFTLLGLALAIGIVVDDAIMVMENIFRHAEQGKDRVTAAREGTAEITFAALAATIAVVAIFIPVVFMKGVMGKFFLQFGVTLSVAVMFSYLEAVTLAPARCAQLLKTGREGRTRLGRVVDAGFHHLSRGYRWLLGRALRWPLLVLAAAGVLLFVAYKVFTTVPAEFVPAQDQSRLMVRLQTAVGSNLNETDKLFQQAEDIVNARPEIRRAMVVVGGGPGASGVSSGIMFLMLHPPEQRMPQAQLADELRKGLNAIPGLRAAVQDMSQSGFTAQRGYPVEFSVRGPEFDKLVELTAKIKEDLQASGLVTDLDSDYRIGMPELRIAPNRALAAELGVSIEHIAQTLGALVGGTRVGKYSTGGRRIDVRMRLVASDRARPEDLDRLKVRTAGGDLYPLSRLVTREEQPALQGIYRQDRERAISLWGNVAPGHAQDEVLAHIESLAAGLPDGYHLALGGASVAFRESFGGLLFALALGIVVAYMVLASQFNSFLHPITVLTILPLSVAGAIFALKWSGATVNVFSMIGVLLLLGISKKNSIILVDYATQLRGTGLGARDAMLAAGPVRLRPILMTSVATLMAAVPASLALGPGSEVRAPMAIAVIGGLAVSTLLSLLVVPAFYVLADDVRGKLGALVTRQKGKKGPRPSIVPLEDHRPQALHRAVGDVGRDEEA
jgi:hydrophobe/amphiphile efflux-1 (HAE1) family protein